MMKRYISKGQWWFFMLKALRMYMKMHQDQGWRCVLPLTFCLRHLFKIVPESTSFCRQDKAFEWQALCSIKCFIVWGLRRVPNMATSESLFLEQKRDVGNVFVLLPKHPQVALYFCFCFITAHSAKYNVPEFFQTFLKVWCHVKWHVIHLYDPRQLYMS